MPKIKGKAYVLGENVDTDQIIPAHHLVYNLDDPKERKLYGQHAFSGVPVEKAGLPKGKIPFVAAAKQKSEYAIVIASSNFGCGSSREHAPVALNMAGVTAIVATSYARIFYRNSVDGGYVTPFESEEDLSTLIKTGDEVEIDPDGGTLKVKGSTAEHPLKPLGEVADILESGGLFEYARQHNMIS
ncbi:3-isopropylmalate dehydratase [candidate division KSB1 bacterium]|nr:3-isopropylmalate dehydratase [candidate division KSB1 bacterium]